MKSYVPLLAIFLVACSGGPDQETIAREAELKQAEVASQVAQQEAQSRARVASEDRQRKAALVEAQQRVDSIRRANELAVTERRAAVNRSVNQALHAPLEGRREEVFACGSAEYVEFLKQLGLEPLKNHPETCSSGGAMVACPPCT